MKTTEQILIYLPNISGAYYGSILQVNGPRAERMLEYSGSWSGGWSIPFPPPYGGLHIFSGYVTNEADILELGYEPDFEGTYRRPTDVELRQLAIGENIFDKSHLTG